MLLLVLRHGKAEDGYPDEKRALTSKGKEDVANVLHRRIDDITDGLSQLTQIQSSSLLRAQQTAEIAASMLDVVSPIKINDALTPWATPTEFLHSLDDQLQAVLIASHQPFVSDLVQHLTGKTIAMPTATLAAVELDYPDEGGGDLLWIETPQRV